MPLLSTSLSLLEQASARNDEVGRGWRALAKSAIIFWRSRPLPPLSTSLSLPIQASERNDEDGGGRRAPANSAIVF